MTPPGINPGTVRLVAQCLNHYATPGHTGKVQYQKKNIYIQRLLWPILNMQSKQGADTARINKFLNEFLANTTVKALSRHVQSGNIRYQCRVETTDEKVNGTTAHGECTSRHASSANDTTVLECGEIHLLEKTGHGLKKKIKGRERSQSTT